MRIVTEEAVELFRSFVQRLIDIEHASGWIGGPLANVLIFVSWNEKTSQRAYAALDEASCLCNTDLRVDDVEGTGLTAFPSAEGMSFIREIDDDEPKQELSDMLICEVLPTLKRSPNTGEPLSSGISDTLQPGEQMNSQKIGLVIGGTFTVLVVGLLAYLHLSDTEEVPKPRAWEAEKALYVCEAPDWVVGNLDKALEFVEPWSVYSAVVTAEECAGIEGINKICEYELKALNGASRVRTVPCIEGAVVLTGADQGFNFGQGDDGGHGDEGLWTANDVGLLKRVTTVFPDSLELVMPADPESFDRPKDIEFLVVVHALLHAEGYGHVFNDLVGPFTAEPTGHVMNRNLGDLGEATDGL